MGKITNVLNKIQESRQYHQEQKVSDFFYVKDDLEIYSRKVAMVIVALIVAGAIVAFFITKEIHGLEKSLKLQEKKFNDLTVFMSNTKSLSDNQIQDFNFRLKNEAEDRKIQINKLALIDNAYYINIIKSIDADILQINYLDKYMVNLDSKLEKVIVSDSQAKDLSSAPKEN